MAKAGRPKAANERQKKKETYLDESVIDVLESRKDKGMEPVAAQIRRAVGIWVDLGFPADVDDIGVPAKIGVQDIGELQDLADFLNLGDGSELLRRLAITAIQNKSATAKFLGYGQPQPETLDAIRQRHTKNMDGLVAEHEKSLPADDSEPRQGNSRRGKGGQV